MPNDERKARDAHAEIWPLLPWYVNGSIAPADQDRVEQHLDICVECRAEHALLVAMADDVQGASVLQETMERNLERLSERLDAERDDAGGLSWARRLISATPPTVRLVIGLQTVAVAAAVMLLVVGQTNAPTAEGFRLLADPGAAVAGTGWRVRFEPDARAGEIEAFLRDHGLHVVHGPTLSGLYTLAHADETGLDAEATDAGLADAPVIAFWLRTQ